MYKKEKKGFTLIELIIVVAIIGILAAIAVPKFNDVQKKSKISADIASAKVIANAAILKIADGQTLSNQEITAGSPIVTGELGIQSVPSVKLTSAGNAFYVKINGGNVSVHVGNSLNVDTGLTDVNQVYPKPISVSNNPYY